MKKEVNKRVFFEILTIILIALFCISLTPKTLQNDTFYTIKIGEHIIQEKGIDMKDPFSWHENLEYTYPHWLYDVMIYSIYNLDGMTGIYISTCIFSIILGITIYKVNEKLVKNKVLSFVITIGAMYLLKDFITARAQLVTFILFELELFCIERLLDTCKKRYGIGLIIISILMANLHVAVWPFFFVLYLPYIAEFIIYCIEEHMAKKFGKEVKQGDKLEMQKRPGMKYLIIVMIICALTGLLTPLGTTPYTYLYKTMQGNTTQNINEHLPMTLINEDNILCVLIIFLAVLIFTKAKIRLCDLFMLCGLTFLMLMTQRQASIFVIICSVILNRLIYSWITSQVKDFDDRVLNFAMNGFGVFMLSSVIIMFCMYFIKPKLNQTYIDENTYPVKMSDWILEYFEREQIDLSEVRLFNEYNYGSYLLFRGIPVFIDSRCDLYAPEYNPGVSIFDDFIASSNLNDWFEIRLAKYNITHMILYKDSKMNMIIERGNLNGYKLLKQDENFVFYEITD